MEKIIDNLILYYFKKIFVILFINFMGGLFKKIKRSLIDIKRLPSNMGF